MKSWYPGVPIELWAEDEARLGLVPTVRRVWALKGQRPVSCSRRRYEWLYLFGFVHPASGDVQWLTMPLINIEAWNIALEEFARAVGAGPRKHVILLIDGAGWHTGHDVQTPEGVHVVFLPPYSPELQPAEKLWPLVNEEVANKDFDDMDEFEDTVVRRCLQLRAESKLIHGATLYHWWNQLEEELRS